MEHSKIFDKRFYDKGNLQEGSPREYEIVNRNTTGDGVESIERGQVTKDADYMIGKANSEGGEEGANSLKVGVDEAEADDADEEDARSKVNFKF